MQIITHGFARALNKLVNRNLSSEYCFAVKQGKLRTFLPLLRQALAGEYITSKPGETYDFWTGTDITICTGGAEVGDILIPCDEETMQFFVSLLDVKPEII